MSHTFWKKYALFIQVIANDATSQSNYAHQPKQIFIFPINVSRHSKLVVQLVTRNTYMTVYTQFYFLFIEFIYSKFQTLHITSCFLGNNLSRIEDEWNELPHEVHGSIIKTEDLYLQKQV
jgi:hypothetical protein